MTRHVTPVTATLFGRGRPVQAGVSLFTPWSRFMPKVLMLGRDQPVRFALYPDIGGSARPMVFPSLDRLCRRIHRERDGAAIELLDAPLMLGGEALADCVSIWTRDAAGMRDRFLGAAFAEGRDRQQLQAALYDAEPFLAWDSYADVEAA